MKPLYVSGRHRTCDGAIAARCRLVLLLFVSLTAALITHIVIDVLGDVLLAHDTYDDLTHGSRQMDAIIVGVALIGTFGFAMWAALREARGDEGALLTLLRRAMPRCPWRHWAAVTALSLAFVAVMEACDAAVAGQPCGNVVALYGGSLLLAATVAASVAAFITVIARIALRRLAKLHRVIVAIAAAFVRIAFAHRPSAFDRRSGRSVRGGSGSFGSSPGGRAPPRFPSLGFFSI